MEGVRSFIEAWSTSLLRTNLFCSLPPAGLGESFRCHTSVRLRVDPINLHQPFVAAKTLRRKTFPSGLSSTQLNCIYDIAIVFSCYSTSFPSDISLQLFLYGGHSSVLPIVLAPLTRELESNAAMGRRAGRND